ncbi:MAG: hypothetical protein ABJZ55_24810 [Fuerstiella sp.]
MKTDSWRFTLRNHLTMRGNKLRQTTLILIFISLSYSPTVASAQSTNDLIRVRETIWAFNGKIQPGQFNPLSILIDNGASGDMDGQFLLQKSNNLISAAGTVYQHTGYIESTGRRWIHFYPYIPEDFQSKWHLRFQDKQSGKTISLGSIQQPSAAPQNVTDQSKASELIQAIVLLSGQSAMKVPSNLKRYPEEIFPPYVTATSALHTVFLDHEPNWEEPRQKAFMDWLHLGGNVHILKANNGEYPKFTGLLTNLDQPLTGFNVGTGRVTRQNIRLRDLTESAAEKAIRAGLTFDMRFQGSFTDEELEKIDDAQAFIDSSASSLDMHMFQQMQERTQPEHNWLLIFCLAIVYILLIFPGCYRLSQNRKLHFLTTYAAVAGLSLIFSCIFLFIGQRGYGESTWLQTLAVAKVADNGDLAVQQWNTLFVTGGNRYQISANDNQALMNAGVTGDNTVANVVPGKEAKTNVRIPPYSAQSLNSTRHLKGDPWNLSIAEQQIQDAQLIRLKIQADDSFLPVDTQNRFYAVSGSYIYTLKYDANSQQLHLFGSRRLLADFCRVIDEFRFMNWGQRKKTDSPSKQDEIYLDEVIPGLVHRSLMADRIDAPSYFYVPADRIRLLALTSLPKELDVQVSAEARHSGWILYTRDLLINQ